MNLSASQSFALLALLTAIGCGNSDGRTVLTGNVTYKGEPLVYGLIYFNPDTKKGQSGPQGVGEIRNGSYRTNPEYGPVPGPHIVRITGWSQLPEQGMLPPALFTDHEISIDIPNASSGSLNFDVPLKTKK